MYGIINKYAFIYLYILKLKYFIFREYQSVIDSLQVCLRQENI